MAEHCRLLCPLALVAVMACAPTSPAPLGDGQVSAPDDGAARTIVFTQLAPTTSFGPWQFSNTGGGQAPLVEIHTLGITTEDAQSNVVQRLATAMPSLDLGTVVVLPDGRMQTTWRLRSDVTWQDGAPFTGEDVVFSFAANREPALPPNSSSLVPFMERIDALDSHTVVITWKTTHYQALELTHRSLWLYPKHLLGQALGASKEELLNQPYFTSEYVHLGPFRLVDWGLGENMVFERYEGYFLGRPKVGRIVIRVISEPNAMLAALRAGAFDVLPAKTLSTDLYAELAREWEGSGEGVVARAPDNWRYAWFQFDARWARPIEISQDVRLRRGLLFGLDRHAVRELALPGIPEADTDSFLAPNDPRNSVAGQPFARYPYDPNRALQEWSEAGWKRAEDGRILNRAGRQVQVEIRGTQQEARQIAAIAAGWRQLGLEARESVTPPALSRDLEYKATFPAMESRGRGVGEGIFISFDGREAAVPENRWLGANNGHYANPALDRLIDQMYETVDSRERTLRLREAGDILANDLPAIPIHYGMMFMAVRSTVKGPLVSDFGHMSDSSGASTSRSAHLWERV